MSIAFVAAWGGQQDNNTSASLTLSAINASGCNFIAVAIETAGTISSVTDSAGNTYQKAYGPFPFTAGDSGSLYYAQGASGTASHTITVSCTATTYITATAACYSGMGASGTLDQSTANNTGTGTTLTTATSGTTTQASELVVSTGSVDTGLNITISAGSGYSLRGSQGSGSIGAITYLEDDIVSVSGTQTATATSSVSANWGCALATFRGASGTAPALPQLMMMGAGN